MKRKDLFRIVIVSVAILVISANWVFPVLPASAEIITGGGPSVCNSGDWQNWQKNIEQNAKAIVAKLEELREKTIAELEPVLKSTQEQYNDLNEQAVIWLTNLKAKPRGSIVNGRISLIGRQYLPSEMKNQLAIIGTKLTELSITLRQEKDADYFSGPYAESELDPYAKQKSALIQEAGGLVPRYLQSKVILETAYAVTEKAGAYNSGCWFFSGPITKSRDSQVDDGKTFYKLMYMYQPIGSSKSGTERYSYSEWQKARNKFNVLSRLNNTTFGAHWDVSNFRGSFKRVFGID